MSKKEVAAAQEAAMPAFMNANSNRGSEGVGADDLVIPRIEIIQSLSPQRKKSDEAYIEGAEEGMAFNTVTNELYNGKLIIVPVFYRKEWVLWKDRDAGGGFAVAFPNEADAARARQEQENPDQYEALDTGQHFVLIVKEDGSFDEAVISMAKTKMKASRQLNSLVKMRGGDRFSSQYELEVVEVKGDKGDYFNWKVSAKGWVSEEIYRAGESLYEAVSSGQRDVSRADTDGAEGEIIDSEVC